MTTLALPICHAEPVETESDEMRFSATSQPCPIPPYFRRARLMLSRLNDFSHFDFYPDEDLHDELYNIAADRLRLIDQANILKRMNPAFEADYEAQLVTALGDLALHLLETVGESGIRTLEHVWENDLEDGCVYDYGATDEGDEELDR